MVTADAVIHGDRDRLLGFDKAEHPLAIQLGGNVPEKLYTASQIAADWGYDEVNLNCGCPSNRVKSGAFGAVLMREPELVAECISAMQSGAPNIPATVKCRIALDDDPEKETLWRFVDTIHAKTGCTIFIVHARKAWLKGLSPKENREIPPLNYDLVTTLKREFPKLSIILNGGLINLDTCKSHLACFDGVMLGRAAYQNPSLLLSVDTCLTGKAFRSPSVNDRLDALDRYRLYMVAELAKGTPLQAMTRHILGLFNGIAGARGFRQTLSEKAPKAGANLDILNEATHKIIAHFPDHLHKTFPYSEVSLKAKA